LPVQFVSLPTAVVLENEVWKVFYQVYFARIILKRDVASSGFTAAAKNTQAAFNV
jgi:hypothetical protein